MSTEQKTNVTLISNLSNSSPEESTKISSDTRQDSLSEIIMDFTVSIENRMEALNLFYTNFGEDNILEIINRLSTMYMFSGTKSLEKYLYEMSTKSNMSSFLKLTCAKSLCFFNPENEIGYTCIDSVCKSMTDNLATPCQIEAICLLMCHKKFKTQSKKYLCNLIDNHKLDCDYRYKAILSIETKHIKNKEYFIKEASMTFFKNKKNRTLYRILAGQYMMQKHKITDKERNLIEQTIMAFAQDPDIDYNLRADSADVILRVGSEENKVTARKIIMMLGRENGDNKTIFDNAQNVHVDEIEESVIDCLELLASINMKTISGIPGTPEITFEYVKKQIDIMLEKQNPENQDEGDEGDDEKKSPEQESHDDRVDRISVSLNRIYMDRALYSKYNCNLLYILLKVWTYLSSHDCEEEMRKRLLEELYEMSGTCSTGFAGRLINVISGFGDFNLRISWRDQIVANFSGRLNCRAKNITDKVQEYKNFNLYCKKNNDTIRQEIMVSKKEKILSKSEQLEKFQEQVLNEIMINSNEFESRKNFLKFFRKNMLSIREELYEEFKDHITDTDFDLYFRYAISNYDTGMYV